MATQLQASPPDNTPIIIGAAQYVERLRADTAPPFHAPMQLAATAAGEALADAGAAAGEIDTIAVIRLFSDAAKAWQSPFGGSNNPPESVARLIGAAPTQRIYSDAGGTEPLQLMMELCRDIARGDRNLVLLTGAEAIASQRFALRHGYEADWREEFDLPLDNREYRKRFASREELRSGMTLPVHYYALVENHQGHRLGHDPEQHRHHMARLMAPFSEVAAANPYAQFPVAYTAEELALVNSANYRIALPYSKLLVAQDAVNQSAALLLTSVGNARRLGVDPAQWVFLEAYAEGEDRYLSQRQDPGRSEAMSRILTATLEMAGASCADIDLVDLYSCFPCAVHAACEVLGLPTDGSRALTVTGGLPFFGGPGNNYSMHALAESVLRLRGGRSRALVTANGGILSKHAAVVLTPEPTQATSIDWDADAVYRVEPEQIDARPMATAPLEGKVLTYTVITRREEEDTGIVLAETGGGERFLASSADPRTTATMAGSSPVGRAIAVQPGEERHLFSFARD